jgi:hypothetical protein
MRKWKRITTTMNEHVPTPAPAAIGERDFGSGLNRFFEGCKRISDEYMDANYSSLKKPAFELQELQKRYRVVRESAA